MNRTGSQVVKNASVLMAAQLITWVFSLLLTIFLPKYLGAAGSGEFVLASSIWSIMALLISFGMDTLLTKEIARQPERTPELVGAAFILRVIFFVVSCGLVATYLQFIHYSPRTVAIIWIIGIATLIGQVGLSFQSALQGMEKMHYPSIVGIITKAITTVLVITAVVMGYTIYTIGFVYVITAALGTTLLFIFLSRSYRPRFRLNRAIIMSLLKASFPYLMSSMGLVIYGQIDVLVISSMLPTNEIGWYGVSSQLTGTLVFIPVVFTTAIFPALTRSYSSNSIALPQLMRKSFDLMLLVSIPIGFGICVIAQPLVLLLYGPEFAPSGAILAIMGIVLIFMYQNILIGQFLISTDRTNIWTVVMVIATVITIVLDVVLVPLCQQWFGNGAIGGALSFVVTECGMCVAGIMLLPKGSLSLMNVRTAALIILAGLLMVAATWWFRTLFLAIPIVVAAVTYTGLIAILRIVPREDFDLFKNMAQSMINRLRQRTSTPVEITGV